MTKILDLIPGVAQLKLWALAATIVFGLGALGSCRVNSMIDDWKQHRADKAQASRLKTQLSKRDSDLAAEQSRATQRATALEELSEHIREVRRGLAHVNEPLVATVVVAGKNTPVPVACGGDVSPDRLLLLRSALERADRTGGEAHPAKR